jgi:hypothetical protein
MALYLLHDLTLEVRQEGHENGDDLPLLLQDLSFTSTPGPVKKPSLHLSVCLSGDGDGVPRRAREVFRADGFRGLDAGEDFYLTDGSSLFHLQALRGRGKAQLAPSFFNKPPVLQRNFWAFGLLKLLRPLGIYSLHAAGVVGNKGLGILIVGESGSGKSTLAIGLIRRGWGYLSDDAVLLRPAPEGIKALAFRRHSYINADAAADYSDLPLGEEVPDTSGRRRRMVRIEDAYPGQYVPGCIPRVLLFSRITPHAQSALLPLDRISALRILLAQSGPQLFDRDTMPKQMEGLRKLVYQSAAYELRAGPDLYRDPTRLVQLLAESDGEARWPGLL